MFFLQNPGLLSENFTDLVQTSKTTSERNHHGRVFPEHFDSDDVGREIPIGKVLWLIKEPWWGGGWLTDDTGPLLHPRGISCRQRNNGSPYMAHATHDQNRRISEKRVRAGFPESDKTL